MANDARRPSGRLLPQTGELQVWREFIEAFEELRSEVASRLLAETALSAGDYVVLLALSEAAGERLRSSQLAEAVAWERSRLSHHLGRMERRGLIRREECPADSRGAEVVLTTDGAAASARTADGAEMARRTAHPALPLRVGVSAGGHLSAAAPNLRSGSRLPSAGRVPAAAGNGASAPRLRRAAVGKRRRAGPRPAAPDDSSRGAPPRRGGALCGRDPGRIALGGARARQRLREVEALARGAVRGPGG